MSTEPQYAPGDPVLVPGKVARLLPSGLPVISFAQHHGGRDDGDLVVTASDVHPVPPTPDPRDVALAAIRALIDGWEATGTLWRTYTGEIRRALDGVAPVSVPAPVDRTAAERLLDLHLGWSPGPSGASLIAALDAAGVLAPVPAPPVPTPTGWTAGEVSVFQEALGRDLDLSAPRRRDAAVRRALAAVLALRAEEAAAAAPATTDAPTPGTRP